jgi:hypothetical protein
MAQRSLRSAHHSIPDDGDEDIVKVRQDIDDLRQEVVRVEAEKARKGAALTLSSSDTPKKMQKWIPPDARVEGGLAITPKFTHDSA